MRLGSRDRSLLAPLCGAALTLVACGRINYARRDAALDVPTRFDIALNDAALNDVAFDGGAVDAAAPMDARVSDATDAGRSEASAPALDALTDASVAIDASEDAAETAPAPDAATADVSASNDAAVDGSTSAPGTVRPLLPVTGLANFQPTVFDVDDEGNVYIAGPTTSSVDIGGGPISVVSWALVVASFTPDGAFRWQRVLNGTTGIVANALSVTGDGTTGALLITGWMEGTATVPSSTPITVSSGRGWLHYSVGTDGTHRFASTYTSPVTPSPMSSIADDQTFDVAAHIGPAMNLGLGTRFGNVHVARFDTANNALTHRAIAWNASPGGSFGVAGVVRVGAESWAFGQVSSRADFGTGLVGSGTLTSWGFVASYDAAGTYVDHRFLSVSGASAYANVLQVLPSAEATCLLAVYQGTPVSFIAADASTQSSYIECTASPTFRQTLPFDWLVGSLNGSRLVVAGRFSAAVDIGGVPYTPAFQDDILLVEYDVVASSLTRVTHLATPTSTDTALRIAIDGANNRVWVLARFLGDISLDGRLFDSGGANRVWLGWLNL